MCNEGRSEGEKMHDDGGATVHDDGGASSNALQRSGDALQATVNLP